MENQNIEYKSSWRDEYLKQVCGFANSDGGELLIGVNDDGHPVGLENIRKLLEVLPNSKLGIVPYVNAEKQDNFDIIRVAIKSSKRPVDYNGKFYKRSGSVNIELTGDELTNFLISKSGKTWDEHIEEDATIDDLDLETIENFKNFTISKNTKFNENNILNFLENLRLLENSKLKKAAVLLFGKNPRKFYNHAYLKIGKFFSLTEIIGSDEIEGNLFNQVEGTIDILKKKYLKTEFKIDSLYRKEILEYPEEALREAIINALIHRDYLSSAHIQIKIFEGKIWIWNDGRLPEGITIEDLKKVHSSKLRNKLIADIFFRANLIEKWGTGTLRIVDTCKKAGLPEPEFLEEQGGFSVWFFKDYAEVIELFKEKLEHLDINKRQINAVLYIKQTGKITNKEYMKLNNVSKQTASKDLKVLVEKNILNKLGGLRGRGVEYTFFK